MSIPARLQRVIDLYESRSTIERVESAGPPSARACLTRAQQHLGAAETLLAGDFWDAAYTTAYDAYRMAADALVLLHGYRTVGKQGAHEAALALAAAALNGPSVFETPKSTQFRQGRAAAEYFDPDRPDEKTRGDAQWALDQAREACALVDRAL